MPSFDSPWRLWWLSTEKFSRHPDEVGTVLDVIESEMSDWVSTGCMEQLGIWIWPICKLELLPVFGLHAVQKAEAATRHHAQMLLNVGVGYGGRQEIVEAVKGYLQEHFERRQSVEEIFGGLSPDANAKYLYVYDCPDPDLIIRTRGEVRLSGFMLWQSAFSGYYSRDEHWPSVRRLDFLRATRSYQ